MAIPIQNIYYLLCYAWDKLEEKEVINVKEEDATELIDLFAKVIINGTAHLFKRGLDRYYVEHEEEISGVKGKLNLDTTIKRNLLTFHKTSCLFDEFSYNILHNQILKTTISKLMRTEDLDGQLKEQLKRLYWRLSDISEINIKASLFRKIRLHKNNYFYDFLLKICEIIHNNIFINQETGNYKFRDFLRDETKMRALFEAFIRNFYKRELVGFDVGRENIDWQLHPFNEDAKKFLPKMETDISLKSESRKIIIDTKYYKETLKGNFDTEKIHSGNLYQLFAYLKNVEVKDELSRKCEGILLYPTVDKDIKLEYQIEDHKLSIRTINLNQHWTKIDKDLKQLIVEEGIEERLN